jgi:hypothetical protein
MVVETEDGDELPTHTQSMRQALRYCLSRLTPLPSAPGPGAQIATTSSADCNNGADFSAKNLSRRKAYEELWAAVVDASASISTIKEIRYSDIPSPADFRRRFHDLNVPCLISFQSDDHSSPNDTRSNRWFSTVDRQWRLMGSDDNESTDNTQPQEVQAINRNWFVNTLGAETPVPVRFQPPDTSTLDEDGRATECQTKEISVSEWTQMLEEQAEHGKASSRNPYYLKDWHLLLQLQEQEQQKDCCSPPQPLYECPPIFEFDLLNSFMTRFTKGDYRFCYWGPKGSFTSRHSDVLHSFSWSYNVIGTKQWTFFRNTDDEEDDASANNNHEQRTLTVIQKSGQAMFVPSQWQHEVVNLEETISINHNWVTSANLDLCWECLTTEMVAIDKELAAWGIHDDLEAKESMLRGCVGLDVTSFFLMTLVRLSDLLPQLQSLCAEDDQSEELVAASEGTMEVRRLVQMLLLLRRDESLQLEGRLEAVLHSKILSVELSNITGNMINLFGFS